MKDFLRDTGALQGLSAAEPWGDAALTLDIPGGPYAFEGMDTAIQRQALERLSSVVPVSPSVLPGAILTGVRRIDSQAFRPVANPLYPFEMAQANRPDGIDLVGWRLAAQLRLADKIEGRLGVARAEDLVGLGDLDNYLRVLVAYSLLARGGLLMHSACVVHRESAYLFVGRSGAGKTTMSTLALEAGLDVLSDDLNALSPGLPPLVRKLPFAGTLGQRLGHQGVFPLRAICWLRKGDEVHCDSMSPALALARLAVCAPYVNADPFRSARLFEVLEKLVATVPVVTLTFPLGVDVLSVVERLGARTPCKQ